MIICCSLSHAQDYIPDISVLAHKTYAERTYILTPYYETALPHLDSIQIFDKIQKIEELALAEKDVDLLLETKILKAHYYYYRDRFETNFVVNYLLEINKIAQQKKVLWLEVRVQNMLGCYLSFHRKEYARGIEYLERSEVLLNQLTEAEFPLKPICLSQIGVFHYEFRDYRKAANYFRKSTLSTSENTRYYNKQSNLNFLGASYQKLQMIDSSNYYFHKNLENARTINDSTWIGISSGNLGHNYFLQGNYKAALPLLEKDMKYALKNEQFALASGSMSILAAIALEQENIDKANEMALKSKSLIYKSGELHRLAALYPILAKIKAKTNEPDLVAVYIDSTRIVADSLSNIYDARIITRAKQKIALEQLQNEQLKKEQIVELTIWKRNILIGLLIAIVLIIVLIYNRYLIKSKHREQAMMAEKDAVQEKLEIASQRLDNFRISIINKNQFITQVESKLEYFETIVGSLPLIESEKNQTNASKKEALKTLKDSAILTDKDWREFVELFETVYPDFLRNLQITYPELTPSETRLLTLSKLRLGNIEMASTLGVGAAAIRQIKSRLRKKIKFSKDVELYILVQDL